jgi:hypothetical protein
LSAIGIDDVDTANPLSMDSHNQFQIFIWFEKLSDFHNFPRLLEHATGGNGLSGYSLGGGVFSTDELGLLLYNGAGTSISFGANKYAIGDIVNMSGIWNNSGNENLNISVNRNYDPGAGLSSDLANANSTTTADFRIGGSTDWTSGRSSHSIMYRVLIYSAFQSDRNKTMMDNTHGRMFPVKNLVAAYALTSFGVSSEETITATLPSIRGPELTAIDGTPKAKASIVGHHPPFQGMMY